MTLGSLQSVDKVEPSRFLSERSYVFFLMSTSSSSVEIAFIFVQTLWTMDQRMIVATLLRCPRVRLRLESDDKPCASSDGPKVVCSH